MKKIFICLMIMLLCSGCVCFHKWEEATCEEPKTCAKCGEADGEPLGHEIGDFEVVKTATATDVGIEQKKCNVCEKVFEEEYIYYYDITDEEVILYTNVLNTIESIKECLIYPETMKVLGATSFSDNRRTTVCLQWKGMNGKIDTYYFWKDVSKKSISNQFGQRNYEGNPNSHTVKELDLIEINYYANSGAYEKTIVSSNNIIFK